jgi:predicted RNA-binding Zn-ribbon protein involved in translation (DUF1610 family)
VGRREMSEAASGDGRAVLVPEMAEPALRGGGDVDHVCPGCGAVLAEKIGEGRVWDLVIECPGCGSLAEFPRLPEGSEADGYVFFPAGRYRIRRSVDTRGALLIGVGAIRGRASRHVN